MSNKPAAKTVTTNDLMGFTAAMNNGIFYASGHRGNDSNLPNPLGLIKTSDGCNTWEPTKGRALAGQFAEFWR